MNPPRKPSDQPDQPNGPPLRQSIDQRAILEFETVEEVLRYDANQTPVPDTVAERLKHSLGDATPPKPPVPWWKRLFGLTSQ